MRRPALVAFWVIVGCTGDDAGLDAGQPDARVVADAQVPARDAGTVAFDAGAVVDAGADADAGVATDASTPDAGVVPRRCDAALAPIFQGGTSTTSLDGRLVLFAVDALAGAPIAGATVVVETADDVWLDTTDGVGCLDLVDSDLVGPVTLSVYSSGKIFRTIVGIDRDRVTVPIHTPEFPVPSTRSGRVIGIVGGWSTLTASTALRARIATVEPIHTDIFRRPVAQRMRGTNGINANVALTGGPTMANLVDYDVFVDAPFTVGLVVRGGTLESDGINETHLGVATDVMLRPDEVQMGRRMEIDTPLAVNFTVRRGVPTGLIQNAYTPAVFLENARGLFSLDEFIDTTADAFRVAAPPRVGPLAAATYGAIAVEWQQSMDTGAFSIAVVPGTSSTTLQLPDLPQPPLVTVSSRQMQIDGAATSMDYVRIEIIDSWTISVVAPAARPAVVRIPRPPLGFDDPILRRADTRVNTFGLQGVRLHDAAAADPMVQDRPTKADFARGIRWWGQRSTAAVP